MPHLVILYSRNLDAETDMTLLCRTLADTMLAVEDDAGQRVFPPGGTRVLAYPAPHFAVSDGGVAGLASDRVFRNPGDYAFAYLNLRMARGRSAATLKRVGDALQRATQAHFQPLLSTRFVGVTLQIDEGHEVFDAKLSNLHPLFNKSP